MIDVEELDVTVIHDCYCPNCRGGSAETRLLPRTVSGFREIIVMALTCPDCHFRNSEVTFGGKIQSMGTMLEFVLKTKEDWNRQVSCVEIYLRHSFRKNQSRLNFPPISQCFY